MDQPVAANVERFSGFAGRYDRYRPSPPAVVVDILSQLAQAPRPRLVVDIGSGTGLSTRLWAGRADNVIGIEPNGDMRRQAQETTSQLLLKDVSFQNGTSGGTGLSDACCDIVTVVQALHWMEPGPALAEIARILRTGGVFAACDCDWPPTMHWQAEAAYMAFSRGIGDIEARHEVSQDVKKWPKEEHLARIKASGHFRHVREVLVHQTESGNAERLVELAKSQGGVASLLKHGLTEDQIGLTKLREVAQRVLGEKPMPWYFSYRLRVGVR